MKTPLLASATAFAATAALFVGSPALAKPATDDFVVRYSDLNLASEAGQKALERRIDKAAKEYCGVDAAPTGTRISPAEQRSCYRELRRQARQQFAAVVAEARLGG